MLNDKGTGMMWLWGVSTVRKVYLAEVMLWGVLEKDELWNFGAYSAVLNPTCANENFQLNSGWSGLFPKRWRVTMWLGNLYSRCRSISRYFVWMCNVISSITMSTSPRNMFSANITNWCSNQESTAYPTRSFVIHTFHLVTWSINIYYGIDSKLWYQKCMIDSPNIIKHYFLKYKNGYFILKHQYIGVQWS